MVTDASGNIVGKQRYYPFGETRYTSGTMYTDKLFTGQRQMTDLGIYYYNARFYSPYINRFLSADTIVPGFANPQNLNRFSYGLNNPSRYTDPTGHMAIGDTNEAGCSFKGPACIIKMYGSYGDDDGMDRSLEAFAKRHRNYDPTTDSELDRTAAVIVAAAYSRVGCDGGSIGDCAAMAGIALLSSPGLVPTAPSFSTEGDFYETTVSCNTAHCTEGIDYSSVNIPADRLEHVIDRHTVGGSATSNKSLFNQGVNVPDLIQQAGLTSPYPQGNGRFERIVDAGRIIGVDRYTGQPTSIYTVITDSSGNLATTFPGVPHP
jgi:RHS repeat-associated protein